MTPPLLHTAFSQNVLYDYCLGLLPQAEATAIAQAALYNEALSERINTIERKLQLFSKDYCPSWNAPKVKQNLLSLIANINKEEQANPEQLPIINKYSCHHNLKKLVAGHIPESLEGDVFSHVLTATEDVLQVLIVSKIDNEPEVHTDVYECFIILEGKCECVIGDTIVPCTAGDIIEIPLHIEHYVKVISPQVTAVMQRLNI